VFARKSPSQAELTSFLFANVISIHAGIEDAPRDEMRNHPNMARDTLALPGFREQGYCLQRVFRGSLKSGSSSNRARSLVWRIPWIFPITRLNNPGYPRVVAWPEMFSF
jgi:hypothetical protein